MKFIGVILVLTSVVYGQTDESHKCCRLMDLRIMKCCKTDAPSVIKLEGMDECLQLPGGKGSCDRELCISKKVGVASEDGMSINKAAMKDIISKIYAAKPDLVTLLTKQCVDKDLSKYGPSDACEAKKIFYCMNVQLLSQCKDIDNEGPCNGLPQLIENCKSMLN